MEKEVVDASADYVIEAIREEISDEIADLEDYARRGEAPPHCKGYKIKVNGEPCFQDHTQMLPLSFSGSFSLGIWRPRS